MSVFMISLLLGFLLYQFVLIVHPGIGGSNVTIGRRIRVQLPVELYRTIRVTAILVVFLTFVLIIVMVVALPAHPPPGFAYRITDALTSPRMGAAVFGALVGILLGNVLNRLLKSPDTYTFKPSDYLEIGLIAVLLVLGIGGEEVLRSYAGRINKISVGTTTEVSFTDATPKSTRASAEQPKGAFRNTQGKSGGSTGLQKLFDIGSADRPNITRDQDFIATLARYEGENVQQAPDTGPLPHNVLSPIAACLSGISKFYGDAAFIEQQLVLLSDPLHKIALGEIPPTERDRQKISGKLNEVLVNTADYAPQHLKEGNDRSGKPLDDPSYSCHDAAIAAKIDDSASVATFARSGDTLPYAAMAYASVMAALGHYESAAITMDAWINDPKRKPSPTKAGQWYVLRARLTQSLFLEEWIRQQGVAASSWLRAYHIGNLKAIRDGMSSYKAILALNKKNSDYSWSLTGGLGVVQSGDDGICNIPSIPKTATTPEAPASSDDEERLKTLYSTYLSTRKDWIDHSLKHPKTKQRLATVIESEANDLMLANLKCIANDQAVTRAEHIERYVRSEINMLEIAAAFKSTDEIQTRAHSARQLLALAFQLIDDQATDRESAKEHGQILDRISSDRVLEVQETLRATEDELKSLSE